MLNPKGWRRPEQLWGRGAELGGISMQSFAQTTGRARVDKVELGGQN